MNQFLGKLFLNGKIETQTGLHIGVLEKPGNWWHGQSSDKNCQWHSYIPGSSLKGKMRCTWSEQKVRKELAIAVTPVGVDSVWFVSFWKSFFR